MPTVGATLFGRFYFIDAIEYKDQKSGKLETARGVSYDAVNFRWRDIKKRVADDISEARAVERRQLMREAFAKSLKASVPER